MSDIISTDLSSFDGEQIVADLNRLLRLRTTPIGMKLFEDSDLDRQQSVRRQSC